MREQSASYVESLQLVQIVVRLDGCKLQDLIEGFFRAGSLGVIEHEWHGRSPFIATRGRSCVAILAVAAPRHHLSQP